MAEAARCDARRLQLASFLTTYDRFAMPPMLVAIAQDLGVPLADVAAAAGIYFLAYGLMQPAWGVISVRIGLAASMKWSIAIGSLATLASAFVQDVTTLAITRSIAGCLFSGAFPAALIYVGATAPPQQRQHEVTQLMTGVALGTALSTVISGALTYFVGWRWAFGLSAALCLLPFAYLSSLTELERIRFRDPLLAPLRRVLATPAVYQLLALAVLDGATIIGALTFLPTAVESNGHNAATAAAVTATYGISVLFAAPYVGRLSHHVTASRFILAGALVGALACGLLAVSIGLAVAIVACALLGIAWASMHSSLQTWATEVTPQERSLTVSFFAGSLFAGSALAATIGGPFAERLDFTTLFGGTAVLLVTIGVSGYIARAHWEHHH